MSTLAARREFLAPRRTRETVSGFADLGALVIAAANKILTPPESITPAQAAEKYVNIDLAGGWAPFDNTTAPYMVEPMNMTESREHKGVIFVSSAQSGKTASLILNTVSYHAMVTGMDVMVVCQSGSAATDFAVRRVDRMFNNSPSLKGQILPVRNSDNQKRKQMKNGMLLTIAHPSKNELSGKPVGVVLETDYDRMDDDIDGEGSAFDLGSKRTQTFQSYAMTVAESSPSRPVEDPKKILDVHEAPDCKGILALYNRGDRRKWYWPCPHCDEFFTPSWPLMRWDDTLVGHKQQGDTAYMECPRCAGHITPDQRHDMQQWGVWRAAPGRVTSIASFWLDGTAAAFITWPELVEKFLDADKAFKDTGDETALTKFYNTDLGVPYVPKAQESERLPDVIMGRAEPLSERIVEPPYPADPPPAVPHDVRMLLATIDVQKRMFVVQVHGLKPGTPADIVIVDRFSITRSNRADPHDETQFDFVKPHQFQEDWDLLVEQVMLKQYPLGDGSGRSMEVKLTLCDSGGYQMDSKQTTGSGGVTEKAYNFWRACRARGLGGRFHCVRGRLTNVAMGKRAWIDKPDSQQKDRFAIARGDVPVLFLNANEVKDVLANRLEVLEPGAGRIQFPNWLPPWFYAELCAEYYEPGKGWKNPKGRRNEAWDLLYYAIGVQFSPLLPLDKVDWSRPPPYLLPWDEGNPFVIAAPAADDEPVARAFVASTTRKPIDFAALARKMGG